MRLDTDWTQEDAADALAVALVDFLVVLAAVSGLHALAYGCLALRASIQAWNLRRYDRAAGFGGGGGGGPCSKQPTRASCGGSGGGAAGMSGGGSGVGCNHPPLRRISIMAPLSPPSPFSRGSPGGGGMGGGGGSYSHLVDSARELTETTLTLLRWPNPQVIVVVLLSPELLRASAAVLALSSSGRFTEAGALVGYAYAVVVCLGLFMLVELCRLLMFMHLHMDNAWDDPLTPPPTPKGSGPMNGVPATAPAALDGGLAAAAVPGGLSWAASSSTSQAAPGGGKGPNTAPALAKANSFRESAVSSSSGGSDELEAEEVEDPILRLLVWLRLARKPAIRRGLTGKWRPGDELSAFDPSGADGMRGVQRSPTGGFVDDEPPSPLLLLLAWCKRWLLEDERGSFASLAASWLVGTTGMNAARGMSYQYVRVLLQLCVAASAGAGWHAGGGGGGGGLATAISLVVLQAGMAAHCLLLSVPGDRLEAIVSGVECLLSAVCAGLRLGSPTLRESADLVFISAVPLLPLGFGLYDALLRPILLHFCPAPPRTTRTLPSVTAAATAAAAAKGSGAKRQQLPPPVKVPSDSEGLGPRQSLSFKARSLRSRYGTAKVADGPEEEEDGRGAPANAAAMRGVLAAAGLNAGSDSARRGVGKAAVDSAGEDTFVTLASCSAAAGEGTDDGVEGGSAVQGFGVAEGGGSGGGLAARKMAREQERERTRLADELAAIKTQASSGRMSVLEYRERMAAALSEAPATAVAAMRPPPRLPPGLSRGASSCSGLSPAAPPTRVAPPTPLPTTASRVGLHSGLRAREAAPAPPVPGPEGLMESTGQLQQEEEEEEEVKAQQEQLHQAPPQEEQLQQVPPQRLDSTEGGEDEGGGVFPAPALEPDVEPEPEPASPERRHGIAEQAAAAAEARAKLAAAKARPIRRGASGRGGARDQKAEMLADPVSWE